MSRHPKSSTWKSFTPNLASRNNDTFSEVITERRYASVLLPANIYQLVKQHMDVIAENLLSRVTEELRENPGPKKRNTPNPETKWFWNYHQRIKPQNPQQIGLGQERGIGHRQSSRFATTDSPFEQSSDLPRRVPRRTIRRSDTKNSSNRSKTDNKLAPDQGEGGMPSTGAQVEENSEELNLLVKQLVPAVQRDQDSLLPRGASNNMSQLQDKDISTAPNEHQESKKMSTSPAGQVNEAGQTKPNSTTNGTSSESEDDSGDTNNQSEVETTRWLETITQLILPFDGKMINYGIFISQFDLFIDKVNEIKRTLLSRVFGARIHLASETLDQQYNPQAQRVALMEETKNLEFPSNDYKLLTSSANMFARYMEQLKTLGCDLDDEFIKHVFVCKLKGDLQLEVAKIIWKKKNLSFEELMEVTHERIQFFQYVESLQQAPNRSQQEVEQQLCTRCERRVQTDKEQDDVNEKTLTNKLIKEFQKSLTPDGEGRIHIGPSYTGRQGELVDSSVVAKQRLSSLLGRHLQEKEAREAYQSIIAHQMDFGVTEEVKLKTSTLGPGDDSLNKNTSCFESKELKPPTISSSTYSSNSTLQFPANTPSWPTSASSNQDRRQKVLDVNKDQEATTNGSTTTTGTGDESTNEEFVRQARHKSTEVVNQPSRLTAINIVCVLGPWSATGNTIGQSAHPQLAQANFPSFRTQCPSWTT
ncbi:hypothetical protein GCK72_012339 [Caenorhabditis remanei]|uniref:Uncharacterized protein n=1 Tax=Caenorhabditis remanei TaxID=31234 RepID=A0A6A5GMV9_CAERE|nr:hypothetical protein GCK72_012339 [Caenorhabditis remanei]KAF1755886.1 hypothetical protein GCK72_012339 [Caenorhabditis remanei]